SAIEDALDASGKYFSTLAEIRVGCRQYKPGSAIVDAKEADFPIANFAGETQAVLGIDDASREEKIFRRAEEVRVFQEERTLFREEDFIALVAGYLRLV